MIGLCTGRSAECFIYPRILSFLTKNCPGSNSVHQLKPWAIALIFVGFLFRNACKETWSNLSSKHKIARFVLYTHFWRIQRLTNLCLLAWFQAIQTEIASKWVALFTPAAEIPRREANCRYRLARLSQSWRRDSRSGELVDVKRLRSSGPEQMVIKGRISKIKWNGRGSTNRSRG